MKQNKLQELQKAPKQEKTQKKQMRGKKQIDSTYNILNDNIHDYLQRRQAVLQRIVDDKERCLKTAPEGRLRVITRKDYAEYYLRDNPKDNNGKYISKDNIELARQLAQKDYDHKIKELAKKELRFVSGYKQCLERKSIPDIYNEYALGRKELVDPVVLSDEEYREIWLSQEYEPMGFEEGDAEFYSDKGLRVRSKSEILIANMLDKFKIPFKYELPVDLVRLGTVRPDFTCLNLRTRKEYIWEHFGRMDDQGYALRNVTKLNAYADTGFFLGNNMIATFETLQCPINTNTVKTLIRQNLI